jgi:rare lipoprotein A (peptidoglycan hydrolase)
MIALPIKFATLAEAKTPGSTYCYHSTCHRVKTIAETQELVGVEETIVASHYDDCSRDKYNPCGLTSSGERFHPERPDNTASPIYPDGTVLLVWSPESKQALVVRVNNAGPYWGNRTLDMSRAAAEKLGFMGEGVATLRVRVVKAPEPEEAKYSDNRSYAPVPGDIGHYETMAAAETGTVVAMGLQDTQRFQVATGYSARGASETPQALGRNLMLASYSVAGLRPQSQLRPGQQLVAFSTKQSIWGEDSVDESEAAKAKSTDTNSSMTPEPAKVAAVTEEDSAPAAKRVARRKTQDDDDSGSARSRKGHARNEGRSHSKERIARAQREYAVSAYRDVPVARAYHSERSAEQITSLGIRAQSSVGLASSM